MPHEATKRSMKLGYNTNGLAHHHLDDAIGLLSELGYQSVAITIDHGSLNPYGGHFKSRCRAVKSLLDEHGMGSVVETGARFLLDSRAKHEPTLVSASNEGREKRQEFLRHAIDIAARLGSDCMSCWSGVVHDAADTSVAAEEAVWDRLVGGLEPVLDYAAEQGVVVGFEPEPGMFIDAMVKFDELRARLNHDSLRLTLDVGHLHCLGETPIADYIERYADLLVNVHMEDMRAGVHEHLMFGEGEMEFGPIFSALKKISYRGGVHVELSRHSHDGVNAAKRAMEFLSGL